MGLIDRINAGAVKTMQVGQRYRVAGIRMSEVDDSFNPGQKRNQVIIDTPEGQSYYCPSNVAKSCEGASMDELAELVGTVIEVQTYYSQRIRREIKVGRILTDGEI